MKHVVGFSGGVDSQMCSLWVRRKFPAEDIILLNSQAGRNEHPLTTEFVNWYSANVFPVIEVIPLVKDWTRQSPKVRADRIGIAATRKAQRGIGCKNSTWRKN